MVSATALGLRFAASAALALVSIFLCVKLLVPPHALSLDQLQLRLINAVGFFAWCWFASSLGARLVAKEFTSIGASPIFLGIGYILTIAALVGLLDAFRPSMAERIGMTWMSLAPFAAGFANARWRRSTLSNQRLGRP